MLNSNLEKIKFIIRFIINPILDALESNWENKKQKLLINLQKECHI
jgi:hypothetical protein